MPKLNNEKIATTNDYPDLSFKNLQDFYHNDKNYHYDKTNFRVIFQSLKVLMNK